MLLFALKEFNRAGSDSAAAVPAVSPDSARWTRRVDRELKPLAQEFIQRCTEFQMAMDRFKDAKSPAEAAVAALRNVKGPVEARIAELPKCRTRHPVAPVASSSG